MSVVQGHFNLLLLRPPLYTDTSGLTRHATAAAATARTATPTTVDRLCCGYCTPTSGLAAGGGGADGTATLTAGAFDGCCGLASAGGALAAAAATTLETDDDMGWLTTDDSGVIGNGILLRSGASPRSRSLGWTPSESLESSTDQGDRLRLPENEASLPSVSCDEDRSGTSSVGMGEIDRDRVRPLDALIRFLRCRGRVDSADRLLGLGGVTRPPLGCGFALPLRRLCWCWA